MSRSAKRVTLVMTDMQLERVAKVDIAKLTPGAPRRQLGTLGWSLNVIIERGLQAIEAAEDDERMKLGDDYLQSIGLGGERT